MQHADRHVLHPRPSVNISAKPQKVCRRRGLIVLRSIVEGRQSPQAYLVGDVWLGAERVQVTILGSREGGEALRQELARALTRM